MHHDTKILIGLLGALALACDDASLDAGGESATEFRELAKPSEAELAFEAEFEAERERFEAELPRLEAIQARYEEELLQHPGVVSIGIGRDAEDQTPVFLVVVSDPELARKLPTKVEGVPLRVSVSQDPWLTDGGPMCNGGSGPPCHANQTPLPVQMGNSGAWFLGSACTLGFKACDLDTDELVLVTNSHCAQYSQGCAMAALGDPVKHVGPLDHDPGDPPMVTIGEITEHAPPSCNIAADNYTDATEIVSGSWESSSSHRDIGAVSPFPSQAVPGMRLHYSGRTTGYNPGTLAGVNVTLVVPASGGFCCGSLIMRDQISFIPQHKTMGGDSGSGVLSNYANYPAYHNRVVGLLFATDGIYTYANHIERVMTALNLTLDLAECSGPGPND